MDDDELRRQRIGLCRFGERAFRADDLDALLHDACATVADGLDIRLVKILELLPGEQGMLIRAGVGWRPGVVGHVKFGAHRSSPSGYALHTSEPVISRDLATEDRFEIPPVLRDHGVRSMVNVAIEGEAGGWGVLEVDSPEGRQFHDDDIVFLKSYASFLAAAIDRFRTHADLQAALESNRALSRELQHRIRNMLAKIRALAAISRRTSTSLAAFGQSFDARLDALIRAQDFIEGQPPARVALQGIVRQELDAHGIAGDGRVRWGGPDLQLSPDAAQALAMVFHELATNATKHGAIAQEGGRIEISWAPDTTGDGHALVVRWRESGVSIEVPPQRRGLGVELLEQAMPRMVNGSAALAFHPAGLDYTLRFPLAEEGEEAAG